MARMNISLPDDIRASMGQYPEINWSATASEAFKKKLTEIKSTQRVNNMIDAIERLKSSKEKFAESAKELGYTEGRTWATEDADYQELFAIKQAEHEIQHVDDFSDFEKIVTDGNYDLESLSDSLEGIESKSKSFWDGFITAALEVFDEVEAS